MANKPGYLIDGLECGKSVTVNGKRCQMGKPDGF